MTRQTVETLAKASWALPLLVFWLNIAAASQPDVGIYMAFIGWAIYILAFGCGVFSLLMMRKFGKEKILHHACIGVVMSGLLTLIMLIVFLKGMLAQH